jgi:hypothetical protein
MLFYKLCCYLPSNAEWLIAARDARSNQPQIVYVLKATISRKGLYLKKKPFLLNS